MFRASAHEVEREGKLIAAGATLIRHCNTFVSDFRGEVNERV